MDLENQSRIEQLAEEHGPENLLIILGGAGATATSIGAETVTAGDPTFVGPLSGAQLGLRVYHALEQEFKESVQPGSYEEQIAMLEMVLPIEEIIEVVKKIREEHSKY